MIRENISSLRERFTAGPFLGMVEVIFPGLQLPEDDGKGCPGFMGA